MSAISSFPTHPLATRPITIVEGGVDAIPVLVHGTPAPRDTVEGFLSSNIDGERTIAELAERAGLTAREVLHVVTAMVLEGSVAIGSVTPPPVCTRIDARVEPSTPEDDFVSFHDVFEDLDVA